MAHEAGAVLRDGCQDVDHCSPASLCFGRHARIVIARNRYGKFLKCDAGTCRSGVIDDEKIKARVKDLAISAAKSEVVTFASAMGARWSSSKRITVKG